MEDERMSNFDEKGLDRRKFIKIGGVSTLALTLGATGLQESYWD